MVRGLVDVKVLDGEWYQVETQPMLLDRASFRIEVAFNADWQPVGTQRPWTCECLRRVRSVGVRLFGAVGEMQGLDQPIETVQRPEHGIDRAEIRNVVAEIEHR